MSERMHRGLTRGVLLMVAGVVVAGCSATIQPIAGVNHTDADVYVRLVIRDGGFRDLLMPANSAVLLAADLDVDRAVLFDGSCQEITTAVFGDGRSPYTDGGQVYIGPKREGGVTTERAQALGRAASPTDVCANIPTPGDPRRRVPLDGGGASD